jgi:hypothetical protein
VRESLAPNAVVTALARVRDNHRPHENEHPWMTRKRSVKQVISPQDCSNEHSFREFATLRRCVDRCDDGILVLIRGHEARIPTNHPIRTIRRIVNEVLTGLDGEFAAMYSGMGRPSIAPVRLLRGSFLQIVFSVARSANSWSSWIAT